MFRSIIKQNNINFKFSSVTQPPLTGCVPFSTQNTWDNSSFRNTSQNQKTGLPTPSYVGFGQHRDPTQIRPKSELEKKNGNKLRRLKRRSLLEQTSHQ